MKKRIEMIANLFDSTSSDHNDDLKKLYGNKAYNLGNMVKLNIPIPFGFVISTDVCNDYLDSKKFSNSLKEEIKVYIQKIEKQLKRSFGNKERPLLVSVRSGSSVSMPGMMETVLNLGLNDTTVLGLIEETKNEFFAYDSYIRFIRMYGEIILKISKERFNSIDHKIQKDNQKEIIKRYKEVIFQDTQEEFEQNVYNQLYNSIIAVFSSWNLDRAVMYRRMNKIPNNLGTAVTILSMVFGNKGDMSGTGVLFSRNPSTGERKIYGEFLLNSQGEEIVSGNKTPKKIDIMKKYFPIQYEELLKISNKLETYYKDVQDIEFTIEENVLWILQCRNAKRTAVAEFHIAIDMVKEGLIKEKEAILRVNPESFNQLLKPVFDIGNKEKIIKKNGLLGKGLNAGPGNVYGRIVLSVSKIEEYHNKIDPIIFVRTETSPEDIMGLYASEGILTSLGGMTSHASLIARQLGKVAIVGVSDLKINLDNRTIKIKDRILKEGDFISLDGNSGEIFEGIIHNKPSEIMQVLENKALKPEDSLIYRNYEKFMKWTDKYKKLKVYVNLDKASQCMIARSLGAEGVGLCRTEHMFFEPNYMILIQEMILTTDQRRKKEILDQLLIIQEREFKDIMKKMVGFPVVLRLLDPPLHEFLPKKEKEYELLSKSMKVSLNEVKSRINFLKEFNPMLGNRGCRLLILDSDIVDMQIEAIMEAGYQLKIEEKMDVEINIMIPFVNDVEEIREIKSKILSKYYQLQKKYNVDLNYKIGTMIEIPRAAITANEIVQEVDFFSYGTNDLTQTTFGISRDDSNLFMSYYLEKEIFKSDPFVELDEKGVGELIKLSIKKIAEKRKKIKLSICGEHGGDSKSIFFSHKVGIDYVSCSTYRLPIARLAAAQAAIKLQ